MARRRGRLVSTRDSRSALRLDALETPTPTRTESVRDETAAPAVPAGTVPAWFSAGHYAFATDGSKKRPIILDERDLQERFIRGSGPGGQAINKLSTNVELVHIPTHTRVTCQHTRSRQQNREIARRLMSQRLEWLIKQSWHPRAGVSVLQARIDKIRQRKYHKRKKQHRSVVT